MGINLGAFISPLIVGELMKTSFHLGFGVAAVGMFIGLVVFVVTKKKNLGLAGTQVPNPLAPEEKKKVFSIIAIIAIALAISIAIAIPRGWLTFDSFIAIVGILGFLIPTIYFVVMYRSPKTTDVEQSRIIAFIPLFLASVMFWAIAEQGSTILALYADTRTNLNIFGISDFPGLVPIIQSAVHHPIGTGLCMVMDEAR